MPNNLITLDRINKAYTEFRKSHNRMRPTIIYLGWNYIEQLNDITALTIDPINGFDFITKKPFSLRLCATDIKNDLYFE